MISGILERAPEGGKEFDPYFVPDDWARLQYGRLLWKRPRTKARLLTHWSDPRHPYSERFLERYRPFVERLLESIEADNERLDAELRSEGHSLRTIMREIPPVFGDFY
jgi:hypothetical protein